MLLDWRGLWYGSFCGVIRCVLIVLLFGSGCGVCDFVLLFVELLDFCCLFDLMIWLFTYVWLMVADCSTLLIVLMCGLCFGLVVWLLRFAVVISVV